MSYARARLWLGISGVGTIVVVSGLLLALGVPTRLLPHSTTFSRSDVVSLGTILLLYVSLSLPFDVLGGLILPRNYGRSRVGLSAFLLRWGRGVLWHSAALFGVGMALLGAARGGGVPLTMIVFLVLNGLLLATQARLASALGAGRRLPMTPELTLLLEQLGDGKPFRVDLLGKTRSEAKSDSTYFTGGIVGFPGSERVVLPSNWSEKFTSAELETILLRKRGVIEMGSRLRGLLLALGWNTVGFVLSVILANRFLVETIASVAGLLTCGLLFTLWSFLGLLLLPTPSQRGVFESDAYALQHGSDLPTLQTVIERLDRDQDDEPARTRSVETYFHPLPSVERRLARLSTVSPAQQLPAKGAWHGARMALYLSWAGFGFLSRAVHCNSGRPEVWVFLPSD